MFHPDGRKKNFWGACGGEGGSGDGAFYKSRIGEAHENRPNPFGGDRVIFIASPGTL